MFRSWLVKRKGRRQRFNSDRATTALHVMDVCPLTRLSSTDGMDVAESGDS
jgi:hypothetical protein